jgi:isoaspartyl peptidase/L-asparaginase-like protein (Ntn-hydrolase superfamily)
MPYFVAVHAGAGYHAPHKEAAYAAALDSALDAAAACLERSGSALEAVRDAISVLEVWLASTAAGSAPAQRGVAARRARTPAHVALCREPRTHAGAPACCRTAP